MRRLGSSLAVACLATAVSLAGTGAAQAVSPAATAAAPGKATVSVYRGAATADRLRAPSLLATSGVTIQGARVAADGSFAPRQPDTIACAAAGCPLTMPGYSAALVSVPAGQPGPPARPGRTLLTRCSTMEG